MQNRKRPAMNGRATISMRAPRARQLRAKTLVLSLLTAFTAAAAAQEDPVKLLVDQGKYWQQRGRSDRAAEAWQKILRLNPNQPEALYGMGVAEAESGRADAARTYLERLKQAQPGSPLVARLTQLITSGGTGQQLEQARQLARSGQSEEAVKRYQQAAGGAAPQGNLALEYYQTLGGTAQGWEEARKGLEQLARANPSDHGAQLALAQHLTYRESTRREGIRGLEALSKSPDVAGQARESWRRALTWLGGRPADAPLYQAWLASHPDDATIRAKLDAVRIQPQPQQDGARVAGASVSPVRQLVQQGFDALDAANLERAGERFQSALAQHADDPDALGGMGVLRLKQEKFAEAVELFERATRRGAGGRYRAAQNSATYWLLSEQASAARNTGNRAEARRLLERAIKLDAREPSAQVALADLMAEEGQYAQAEAAYRRVLKQHPDNPDATRGLVGVLSAQNKSAEALAMVQNLTPAQQEKIGSLGKLRADEARAQARAALKRGDTAGARRALEDAMAADPTNPWVRLDAARAFASVGQKEQARGIMDGLLLSNPDMPDALYASALLSAETGDWQGGLDALERIPPQNRTRDMGTLQRRLWVHAEAERAGELAAAGQQRAALAVLQEAERYAQQDADQLGALALAYADAGDQVRALALMRNVMSRTPRADVGMQLQYAAILLKTKQDVELAGVLRQLAGASMSQPQRRDYDDVRVAYIVRQADALTEAGDLVAAYDTLAPALSERPGNGAVRASLARMYAQAGENKKALALYESVLEKDPRNLDLMLAAIGTATAAKEFSWAEGTLQMALAQAPKSPKVLTAAGRLYRAQGKTSRAADYFRAAVAAESAAGAAPGARPDAAGFDRVPSNPFVGLPGQRGSSQLPPPGSPAPYVAVPAPTAAAALPAPVMMHTSAQAYGQPYIPAPLGTAPAAGALAIQPQAYYPQPASAPPRAPAASSATRGKTTKVVAAAPAYPAAQAQQQATQYPAPVPNAAPYQAPQYPAPQYPAAQAVAAADGYGAASAVPARQPLGAQSRAPWLADTDSQANPTGPKTARQELQEIESQRTATLAGGPMLRGRNGDSGMSQLTELQVTAEAKMAAGNGKLVARVTPVALDAGSVGGDFNSASRFGGGPLAYGVNGAAVNLNGSPLKSTSAGTQNAFGVALGVAYESDRFNADLGSTPLGFRYTDVNAGARLNLPLTQRSTLSLGASRRPVTDSLLSYAGVRDERTGQQWGGVMNSSARADVGWDDGLFGIYGYGGYGLLTGHDVKRNTRWEGGGGFYLRVIDTPDQRLMSGVNFTSMGYAENLRYFTFGQGGYFSPQTYFAVTVPLSLSGRTGRLAYNVRGALGVQAFSEDDSNYFPTDAAAQSAANAAVATANGKGLTNATSAVYPGQSKTGLAYNLVGSIEYQAAQQLYVGGLVGIDNARDYRQWYAGVYVRYALQRQTGLIAFPPVPPQSAVGPLPF
ncbi:BCSC C-terminal domain-containing protein [Cupriavidus necator]|uniref:Tetratricopeptide repeat protein n=1 Tax=Cupriavidus necator TaxID=106590 RepID=A0A367PPL8_CUPNE|nr:cellulose biosynthesis protein BcsC [Cupriavidus necator]QQX88664.1 BCSC C-terminal domain-containing protein [Cupriavidus necator]RCJ09842.1 tetratricopeptide repeat protein [Cupriavidus necator]